MKPHSKTGLPLSLFLVILMCFAWWTPGDYAEKAHAANSCGSTTSSCYSNGNVSCGPDGHGGWCWKWVASETP
jgi:hypothetical protein